MGDAKDYERVRSRVDDQRLLKGFLQVALGAESAQHWSRLPAGMRVHTFGALAVPRNAILQPEAVVERLDDHRREVRARVDERTRLLAALGTTPVPDDELAGFVAHLSAAFRNLGIPTRVSRSTVLARLGAQLPARVLADLLNIHINTAVCWINTAGGNSTRYAADRIQRPHLNPRN